MSEAKCKICRHVGEKLFLKGERCFTPKCAVVRKPYKPGVHGKRRGRAPSEYGRQLLEKQKLKALYGVREEQFRRYIASASGQESNNIEALLSGLERRLDNAVFRLGLGFSRSIARQLTSHGHILVNGKRITIPSYPVGPGDVLTIRKESADKGPFKDVSERLKKYTPPAWLTLDLEKLEGKVVRLPTLEDIGTPPANIQTILEYYSR
ncbi:MAG: 30S ribosomal protein S4 [bacterium]|nr:30S ribosomal protein S4 [bacterium]MDZ4295989.1 30S ribosomal protein S4 [Patescibacteria group bacterium]